MLLDANEAVRAAADLSTDVLIVGAGTVGLYLGTRLRQTHPDWRITIIEAGPRVATTANNAASSASVGCRHGGTLLGRAAGLGGTSTLWGGQLSEFESSDLERIDAAWPLTFATLKARYEQIYRDLGIGAPQPHAVYRQIFGAEGPAHSGIDRVFTYWLKQPNFAAAFKEQIQNDRGLTIAINLAANGIEFDGERACGLRCRTANGQTTTINAKSIVFASGTLPTIRFFLSTQRREQVPWRQNEQIGKYFQDHFGGKIADVVVTNEERFRNFFENGWVDGIKLQPKLTFSAPFRRTVPVAVCGMFSFDSDLSQNLANVKALIRSARSGLSFSTLTSGVKDAVSLGRSLAPIAWRYARQRRIMALYDRGVSLNVQAEQIPIAASQVRLSEAPALPDGMEPITVDWRHDGREVGAIHDFAMQADAYLQSQGLARLRIDERLRARDSGFLGGLTDTYHQCGGLRMSAARSTGVVDPDLRVWGTNNVWVAGAAVFPSSSFANCTLTALALSAGIVDRIRL